MADQGDLIEALDDEVRRRNERRDFFKAALGAAAIGAAALTIPRSAAQALTDADVLNLALNLEYLTAQFYAFATTGTTIDSTLITGAGTAGTATGGRKVTFTDPNVSAFAQEIAKDELAHVKFLRGVLASAVVAQPAIDLGAAATSPFSVLAQQAGIVGAGAAFDPYASDENFLLAAFFLEDVAVTGYKGASSLILNQVLAEANAGLLADEAYHAAMIRSTLYAKGVATPSLLTSADKISNARDALDGTSDIDQGISPVTINGGQASNVTPTDSTGLVFGRTTGQLLNIAYLTNTAATKGGFFPAGVNGTITTAAAN